MSDLQCDDGERMQPPHRVLKQLDQICDQFEAVWQEGGWPKLEDYLGAVEASARCVLVRDLLLLELDYRQRRDEPISVETLLRQHPSLQRELGDELQQILDTDKSVGHDTDRSKQDRCADIPCGLRVRCLQCHERIETPTEASIAVIVCNFCGNRFSLVGDEDVGHGTFTSTSIAHFELVERLGMGASGAVWRARDTKLDRTVAVKIPRKRELDSEELETFFREARAAAQLRHPNIVSVHEIGRDGDTVYIVTDVVQGAPLSQWVLNHRITAREATQLCIQLAEAIHHAHESGVIHRDLKPANVMIGVDGRPYVTDFGLARRDLGEVTMTMDGQVLGTPAYMSPEQAMGHGHTADRRTDVYSLGVILFELLTGELPFRGGAAMVIQRVIHEDAPSLRRLSSYVPPDLEAVCLKCLEKDIRRRYATSQELADDLQRFLNGRPTHARPITAAARFQRWCLRNRGIASLSAAACIILLLGIAMSTFFAVQMKNRALEAAKNFASATANEAKAMRNLFDNYVSLASAQQLSRLRWPQFDGQSNCLG